MYGLAYTLLLTFLLKIPLLKTTNDGSCAQQLGITCFKIFWTSFWIIEGTDKQGSTVLKADREYNGIILLEKVINQFTYQL